MRSASSRCETARLRPSSPQPLLSQGEGVSGIESVPLPEGEGERMRAITRPEQFEAKEEARQRPTRGHGRVPRGDAGGRPPERARCLDYPHANRRLAPRPQAAREGVEGRRRARRPLAREAGGRTRHVRAQKKGESDRRLTEDALASRAEEGRGTLRKASGSRVQAENRGCPNGETHAG